MKAATPLSGFTIGITASRRAEEFATLLTRRGASVMQAPAIRIVPSADDGELERVTREIIDNPPDIVVATTGIGFRGWMAAADGWGQAEELGLALASSRLLARGAKAKGEIRAAGLGEEWSPDSESSAEVLDRLLGEGVEGQRIAVQLHGAGLEAAQLSGAGLERELVADFCEVLRRAGAEVIAVPVYRWTPLEDRAPMDRMIELVATGGLDAVSFTSAPAVSTLLKRAEEIGMIELVLHSFRHRVLAACVGSVAAGPLRELEVPTTIPARSRLGALARHIEDELPLRANKIHAAGHELSIRGGCVVVDGEVRQLPPAGMSLMRTLGARPGRVVPRDDLLAALPGGGEDTHAVEMAVARLRASLGAPKAVQTVVKRGYRLALEPVDHLDLRAEGLC
ncbi:uroporphyrinogen-III synthase [Rhodococcus marinonascens]|uniref:uroporphyrinogen-III synthase n=1 Tax=Rhodococcus marinonascens TaxID=38311 RepID=UPI0009337369|nr:uroporphyrinogen-III synthase [Rhodococcus marinonascens]